eukprot:NODE_906_length_3192_cov_0.354995.p2 type:complete len:203 gc:universal NODE_906_length_3192_cov_0.354995:2991-2383(-)
MQSAEIRVPGLLTFESPPWLLIKLCNKTMYLLNYCSTFSLDSALLSSSASFMSTSFNPSSFFTSSFGFGFGLFNMRAASDNSLYACSISLIHTGGSWFLLLGSFKIGKTDCSQFAFDPTNLANGSISSVVICSYWLLLSSPSNFVINADNLSITGLRNSLSITLCFIGSPNTFNSSNFLLNNDLDPSSASCVYNQLSCCCSS